MYIISVGPSILRLDIEIGYSRKTNSSRRLEFYEKLCDAKLLRMRFQKIFRNINRNNVNQMTLNIFEK